MAPIPSRSDTLIRNKPAFVNSKYGEAIQILGLSDGGAGSTVPKADKTNLRRFDLRSPSIADPLVALPSMHASLPYNSILLQKLNETDTNSTDGVFVAATSAGGTAVAIVLGCLFCILLAVVIYVARVKLRPSRKPHRLDPHAMDSLRTYRFKPAQVMPTRPQQRRSAASIPRSWLETPPHAGFSAHPTPRDALSLETKGHAAATPNEFANPSAVVGRSNSFLSVSTSDSRRQERRVSAPSTSVSDLVPPMGNTTRKLSFQRTGSFDLSCFSILNEYRFDQEGSGESTPGLGPWPLSPLSTDSFPRQK